MEKERNNKTAEELAKACKEAFKKYPSSCSHSTWHIIQQYKPDQPFMIANKLINHISSSSEWQEVQVTELSKLASSGVLVVGGFKEVGQDKNGHARHGHVIVVYPGAEKTRGGYYYKSRRTGKNELMPEKGSYALSMSTSMSTNGWPGAKSNGDKTVWDPWGDDNKFKNVRFWKYIGPGKKSSVSTKQRWQIKPVTDVVRRSWDPRNPVVENGRVKRDWNKHIRLRDPFAPPPEISGVRRD
jgi:hypothetical protein